MVSCWLSCGLSSCAKACSEVALCAVVDDGEDDDEKDDCAVWRVVVGERAGWTAGRTLWERGRVLAESEEER